MLDLSSIAFGHQLWLDRCRFEGKVTFELVQLKALSLEGSACKGKVEGQLSASGATFEAKLDMNGLTVRAKAVPIWCHWCF